MANSELHAFLLEWGATAEQINIPNDVDKIGLAGDLALSKGLDRTAEELAAEVGLSLDEVRRVYTALGVDIADLAGFGDGDVALLRLVADDATGLVDQLATEMLRVTGSSVRRIAETAVAAYVQDIESSPQQEAAGLLELAQLNAMASSLVVSFGNTIGTAFRHHMWTAVRRQRSGQSEILAPELIRTAIGFVDLVGFTPISTSLAPHDLIALIEEFERTAFDAALRHGGRIVKSIGDEVMIAGDTHASVVNIAIDLSRTFADHSTISPRAGVSSGDVLFRFGDYYGPVVNLASRLVDVAEPGQVVTDIAPGPDDLGFSPRGSVALKGFADPVAIWATS